MIKKANEQAAEVRENMRGGSGAITIRHFFKKDEFQAPIRLCAELLIPAGGSIGLHEHAEEDEVYIITEGEGLLNDGKTETPVTAGDAILTGQGGKHSISNTGKIDLSIIAVIALYNK
ncbi:cupin domain-containing protein [Spirochaetota bacterium]